MRKLLIILAAIGGLFFNEVSALADFNANFDKGYDAYLNTDYETAIQHLKPLAERGGMKAQLWLGKVYQSESIFQDSNEAEYWIRKAADQDYPRAVFVLAGVYEEKDPGKLHCDKALQLYHKASEDLGYSRAQYYLGYLYHTGTGCELKNSKKARHWYHKAAQQGHHGAMLKLAGMLENQNNKKALFWYKQAIELDRHDEQTLKIKIEELESQITFLDIKFGNYYALIIGINDYQNLQTLDTALNDAKVISSVLQAKYGFETQLLLNSTRSQIYRALNEYRVQLKDTDNFLIYYAGHGVFDNVIKTGYWQPVDADENFNTYWIPNTDIHNFLKGFLAKNVLLIADSCYSGSILSVRGNKEVRNKRNMDSNYLELIINKKTREAFTSGGTEPVMDSGRDDNHSVFAGAFIEILKSNNNVITSAQISQSVTERVISSTTNLPHKQMPVFSGMSGAGHEGGNFVFIPQKLLNTIN